MSAFLMSFIGSLACIISGFILGRMSQSSKIKRLQDIMVESVIMVARKDAELGNINAQKFIDALEACNDTEGSND